MKCSDNAFLSTNLDLILINVSMTMKDYQIMVLFTTTHRLKMAQAEVYTLRQSLRFKDTE